MSPLKPLIIVVDDDAGICISEERLLRSHGFATEAYTSSADLLLSGRLRDADCLILDVQMPGMTGLDLQDYLRAKGRRVPIIFITGHPNENMRQRAAKNGAHAVLEKPYDGQLLIKTIQIALNSSK